MVMGRVGQGAAFATPVAATRPVKAATIQCLNILSLFVDFGMPLAGRRVRLCIGFGRANYSPPRWRAHWARRWRGFTTSFQLVGLNERVQKFNMSRTHSTKLTTTRPPLLNRATHVQIAAGLWQDNVMFRVITGPAARRTG
jgi:hypothetical protein